MAEAQTIHYFPWSLLFQIATILSVLLTLLLVSQILRSPRTPAATMSWLIVIIFLPLLGIPLYLIFGERKVRAQIRRKERISLPETSDSYRHPVHTLLIALGLPSASHGNAVSFHEDAQTARQELFTLIDEARRSIDIAIFILADDPLGRDVLSRLTKKAAQGIRVRLLLDGVGSFTLPKMLLRPLAQAGGEIAWFIPVLHRPLRGRSNLRNHRKIVIADGARVWTGGRNLAQEYLDPGSNWIDLSFCLQGPAIASYLAIFEADWHFARNQPADKPAPLSAAPAHEESSRVQVIPSGPDVADDPIYAAVLTACYEARQRIMIVTPYYVPDTGLQEALRLAALRGVVVDMILPETSNHRLADIARNRYLRELAKAGARIWLLPRVMVHAKALLVDRSFALAGSANLDIRSLFLNYEVVSSFYSASDIDWLARWMETLRERSAQHQPRPAGLLKEILEGVILLGAYEI